MFYAKSSAQLFFKSLKYDVTFAYIVMNIFINTLYFHITLTSNGVTVL